MITREEFIHYITGISEIDKIHWEIASIINEILSLNDDSISLIIKQLDRLKAKVKSHYVLEEWFMNEYNFPNKVGHCTEHNIMLANLETIISKIEVTGYNKEIIELYKTVFLDHIINHDFEMTMYMLKHC